MWDIKSSVTRIFFIETWCCITITIVTIEIARISGFAISTNTKFVSLCMVHYRVCRIDLRMSSCRASKQGKT